MTSSLRPWVVVFAVVLCPYFVNAAQTPSAPPVVSKAQWRDDLRYFARELAKRHKNVYHSTTREQFDAGVAAIDAAIPQLQDHEIIIRLRQLAATVGDGHTSVQIPPYFKRYPISVYWFGRDLRVIAAAKQYESTLGSRVVKIGDLDIAEAAKRVSTCFPSAAAENEWFVLNSGPAFLTRPEVLHALGIAPDLSRASFTLELESGEVRTVDLEPIAVPPPVNGIVNLGLTDVAKEPPLYRQKLTEPFWFTYLQDSQTTYVNFKRYPSLKQNAQALFAFIDRNPTRRLVIDLRQNGGGDFIEGREQLIARIKKHPINQRGRLFVLVGRQTFSAAMVNAIDFRKETNAILVGEPIGERPNSYAENDQMTLPNSRLVVSYSTRYYKFVDEDVPAVKPDVMIEPNWSDFRGGRDGVMDWILKAGI